MPAIRYSHGLKLENCYCSFCGARRDGTVIREKYRWLIRMSCGHLGFRGYTMSVEDMENKGIIPKKQKRIDTSAEDDRRRAEEEMKEFYRRWDQK